MHKRNTSGLRPLNKRPDALEIQRKGGATKSPAKKEAAKKRFVMERLKQGIHTDKDVAWMYERVTNSESFAMDILATIDRIDTRKLTPASVIVLANTKNNIMKTIHGEKLKTENVNLNIELKQITTEEKEDIIGDLLKEEK